MQKVLAFKPGLETECRSVRSSCLFLLALIHMETADNYVHAPRNRWQLKNMPHTGINLQHQFSDCSASLQWDILSMAAPLTCHRSSHVITMLRQYHSEICKLRAASRFLHCLLILHFLKIMPAAETSGGDIFRMVT